MVIHGDCRDVLTKDMIKEAVFVTDPPFNIGYHYKTYKDRMDNNAYYDMLIYIFQGRPFVMIHYPESICEMAIRLGEAPQRVVSWVYNSNTARQHRDIAFWRITPDFRQVTQPYKNPTDKRIKARIERGCTGGKLYDWWNVNQVKNVSKDKQGHPCQMPQEVMDNIIGILPKPKVIIDPFMGTGTTGLSCLKHGINFIGIELDKDYFEIAKRRLEEYQ